MSLLPQFIPHGAPAFGTSMLLTLIDVAELLIWFCILSAAASALTHRIRPHLKSGAPASRLPTSETARRD